MDERRRLGAEGEARAADHLRRRGYRILARNLRSGGVELDLVATKGGLVVFAEVKTRRSSRHGGAELAVDGRKQARLVRGARAWLREQAGPVRRVRFDVLACELEGGAWRIRHLEGAFDAGGY